MNNTAIQKRADCYYHGKAVKIKPLYRRMVLYEPSYNNMVGYVCCYRYRMNDGNLRTGEYHKKISCTTLFDVFVWSFIVFQMSKYVSLCGVLCWDV